MIGSRQLGRVLAEARKAGAKVVLVGDAQQLQPIEAGAPFRAIASQPHRLCRNRHHPPPAREMGAKASMDFAEGRCARPALPPTGSAGMCGSRPAREEAKAAIARDWMAGRKDGEDAIVLAHTRADVRDLNEAIRRARAEEGELCEAAAFQTGQGRREFAAGDRIVFLKNDRELGVKNGTLGTVEAAEADRLTVVLDGTRPTAADYGRGPRLCRRRSRLRRHHPQIAGRHGGPGLRAGERRHGPASDLCRHDAPPRAGDALCGPRRFRELQGDGLAPGAQADQGNHARLRGAARHRHAAGLDRQRPGAVEPGAGPVRAGARSHRRAAGPWRPEPAAGASGAPPADGRARREAGPGRDRNGACTATARR